MSRSFSYLRRALFGTSCAVVFGFGATQALAGPAQASMRYACTEEWEQYCDYSCGLEGMQGRCASVGPRVWCDCYIGPDEPGR